MHEQYKIKWPEWAVLTNKTEHKLKGMKELVKGMCEEPGEGTIGINTVG
jgi:hypothetical protein